MISNIRTHVSLLALTALPMGGCYVEPGPPPPQGQAEVVVQGEPPAPPAAEVEVVPAAPSPEHVWVPGYHRWWGGRYVWVAGRYERRPHPAARWEGAHWEVRPNGRVFVEGRWR
jgi:hypothetical protein